MTESYGYWERTHGTPEVKQKIAEQDKKKAEAEKSSSVVTRTSTSPTTKLPADFSTAPTTGYHQWNPYTKQWQEASASGHFASPKAQQQESIRQQYGGIGLEYYYRTGQEPPKEFMDEVKKEGYKNVDAYIKANPQLRADPELQKRFAGEFQQLWDKKIAPQWAEYEKQRAIDEALGWRKGTFLEFVPFEQTLSEEERTDVGDSLGMSFMPQVDVKRIVPARLPKFFRQDAGVTSDGRLVERQVQYGIGLKPEIAKKMREDALISLGKKYEAEKPEEAKFRIGLMPERLVEEDVVGTPYSEGMGLWKPAGDFRQFEPITPSMLDPEKSERLRYIELGRLSTELPSSTLPSIEATRKLQIAGGREISIAGLPEPFIKETRKIGEWTLGKTVLGKVAGFQLLGFGAKTLAKPLFKTLMPKLKPYLPKALQPKAPQKIKIKFDEPKLGKIVQVQKGEMIYAKQRILAKGVGTGGRKVLFKMDAITRMDKSWARQHKNVLKTLNKAFKGELKINLQKATGKISLDRQAELYKFFKAKPSQLSVGFGKGEVLLFKPTKEKKFVLEKLINLRAFDVSVGAGVKKKGAISLGKTFSKTWMKMDIAKTRARYGNIYSTTLEKQIMKLDTPSGVVRRGVGFTKSFEVKRSLVGLKPKGLIFEYTKISPSKVKLSELIKRTPKKIKGTIADIYKTSTPFKETGVKTITKTSPDTLQLQKVVSDVGAKTISKTAQTGVMKVVLPKAITLPATPLDLKIGESVITGLGMGAGTKLLPDKAEKEKKDRRTIVQPIQSLASLSDIGQAQESRLLPMQQPAQIQISKQALQQKTQTLTELTPITFTPTPTILTYPIMVDDPIIPMLPMAISWGKPKKKRLRKKRIRFLPKKRTTREVITPLPTPLSILETQAVTWKPVTALKPTSEVKREFKKRFFRTPFAYEFPTAEQFRGKLKRKR